MFRMKSLAVASILAVMTGMLGASSAYAIIVNIDAVINCADPRYHKKVSLPEGMYRATIIQGTHTAWRWDSPVRGGNWNTAYYVLVSDDVTAYVGGDWPAAATALDAFNGTTHKVLEFYQPVTGFAKFYVADQHCSDNTGGVSLEIVPLPLPTAESTWGKVKALYR